jgi:hypothetical protein
MAPGEVHVTGREKESAALPRAELVRPVRQLVVAVLLLVALVVLSVLGIGLVKQRVDHRLDVSVFSDTTGQATASLKGGSIDQAEETLMAVGRVRQQIRVPLMWTFVDYLAVMPEYRACAETGRDCTELDSDPKDSTTLLCAELALRSDDPQETLALLPESRNDIHTAAYRRAAAVVCQDFSSLVAAANGSGPLWLDALPRTSMLWASPQARLARYPESMTEDGSPEAGYLRAVAAFHEGRLDVAEEALAACWREGVQPADTAYMLGAIEEANARPEKASAWYGHAVTAGDGHLDGATALLRLAGEPG